MIRIALPDTEILAAAWKVRFPTRKIWSLWAFFTRRSPDSVKTKTGVPVYSMEQAKHDG